MAASKPNLTSESALVGSNKRGDPRARRRLMVRYGISGPEKTGFTANLSESGVFVRTNAVFPPGTTVRLDIAFPSRTVSLWGTVVWARKVPPALAHVLDCGMGLQFLDPPADWLPFFEEWKANAGVV
jgi:hypothetical protein